MYNNQYYLLMKIPTRIQGPLSTSELDRLENARVEHNDRFYKMPRTHTKNKKFVAEIIPTKTGEIGVRLETEFPIRNTDRLGNALRFFAIMVAKNGLDLYVANHRLLRRA